MAGIQREEVLARTPLECELVETGLRPESRGNAGCGGEEGTPMYVYGRERGRPSGQAHGLDEQLQRGAGRRGCRVFQPEQASGAAPQTRAADRRQGERCRALPPSPDQSHPERPEETHPDASEGVGGVQRRTCDTGGRKLRWRLRYTGNGSGQHRSDGSGQHRSGRRGKIRAGGGPTRTADGYEPQDLPRRAGRRSDCRRT